jgi:DNA polymerase-4
MWRVGPKARVKLRAAGLHTIGDLARADTKTLAQLIGGWGRVARDLARGIDDRPVIVGRPPKSLGSEETFERDLDTREALLKPLLRQSMRVADRLIDQGLWARVVTVKIKYRDHRIRSRQTRLARAVSDTDAIFEAAAELLGRFEDLDYGIRLTGVSVSQVTRAPDPDLFADESRDRRERLAATTHALRERFGKSGVTRASLLSVRRGGDEPRR